MDVEASDTIGNVKAKIHNLLDVTVERQHLFLHGSELEDSRTLRDYNIQNKCILTLHVYTTEAAYLGANPPPFLSKLLNNI